MDEFIQAWHKTMLPAAQAQKGWKSGRLLVDRVDRKTGKTIIIGTWETEADALATSTGSAYAERQQQALAGLVSAPPIVEHYEIAGDV
jgi:hypothetical protein